MKWSKIMYQLFAFLVLEKVFGNCDSRNPKNSLLIKTYIDQYKSRLNSSQLNLVNFRVRNAKNNYKSSLLESFSDMYWKEIDGGNELHTQIEFDQKTYSVWIKGVILRKSVKMVYESTTSGQMTRIVDPYKTETPYGRGYCHTKREIRKFRFDRIIEISLTNTSFIKPKNWNKYL